MTAEDPMALAETLMASGRLAEAERVVRAGIERDPASAELPNLLGNVLAAGGDLAGAERAYHAAIESAPSVYKAYANLGSLEAKRGRVEQAIVWVERAIALEPSRARLWSKLGVLQRELGEAEAAMASFERSLTLDATDQVRVLAVETALERLRDPERAMRLLDAVGDSAVGETLVQLRQRALRQREGGGEVTNGSLPPPVVGRRGEHPLLESPGEERLRLEQAIDQAPDDADLRCRMGLLLGRLHDFDGAASCFERALDLHPRLALAENALGTAELIRGDARRALRWLGRACRHAPTSSRYHSDLLCALHYAVSLSHQRIIEEHRSWGARHATPRRPRPPRRERRGAPLRLGLVSPDLRQHAVSRFALPLVEALDRRHFDVVAFSTDRREDSVTERWRLASTLVPCADVPDEHLASLVIRHQVDVLIDLAGHFAGARLSLFALRPAPVQATYLGYPSITGSPSIDVRLTDGVVDPAERVEATFERAIRIDGVAWTYERPAACPPPTPRPRGASLRYGSFNNLAKINAEVLGVWARILLAMPGSELYLKAKGLASPVARRRVLDVLDRAGVDPGRVTLRSWAPTIEESMALYEEVDIALDPFPYNGTTTSMEAMVMGVPVVTLHGERHAARVGSSLNHAVGLDDLSAGSIEEYVRIAVTLGRDGERRSKLRRSLRDVVERSQLGNPARHAVAFQDAIGAAMESVPA